MVQRLAVGQLSYARMCTCIDPSASDLFRSVILFRLILTLKAHLHIYGHRLIYLHACVISRHVRTTV